jgi:hypothetical protein
VDGPRTAVVSSGGASEQTSSPPSVPGDDDHAEDEDEDDGAPQRERDMLACGCIQRERERDSQSDAAVYMSACILHRHTDTSTAVAADMGAAGNALGSTDTQSSSDAGAERLAGMTEEDLAPADQRELDAAVANVAASEAALVALLQSMEVRRMPTRTD